jgi:long-chain acyl-CoA synthetase
LKLITYDDVIAAGKEAKANKTYTSIPAKPDDVFMFSYTSGTTGDPKGVKLTHKMVL